MQIREYFLKNGYILKEKLGQGYISEVYSAIQIKQKQMVAIKKLINMNNMEHVEEFNKKRRILNKIKSQKYALHILDSFEDLDSDVFAVVVDYYDCNIGEVLEQNKFSFEQLVALTYQLLKGLLVFQESGIIYGDIQSKDILFSQKYNQFTIANFGQSLKKKNAQMHSQNKNQLFCDNMSNNQYEKNRIERPKSIKDDVYSIGILLAEVFIQRRLSLNEIFSLKTKCLFETIPEIKNHQQNSFISKVISCMVNPDIQYILEPAVLLQKLKEFQINENSLKSLKLNKIASQSNNQKPKRICFDRNYKITQNLDLSNYQEVELNYNKSFDKFLFFTIFGINDITKSITIVSQNQNITSLILYLSQNNLNSEGAKEIGKSLEQLQNLNCLYLIIKDNYLGEKGARYIGMSIEKLQNLTSLGLSLATNSIGTKGVKQIGLSIEKCKKTKILKIDFSDYLTGSEGARYIGLSIQKLINLQYLNLCLLSLCGSVDDAWITKIRIKIQKKCQQLILAKILY